MTTFRVLWDDLKKVRRCNERVPCGFEICDGNECYHSDFKGKGMGHCNETECPKRNKMRRKTK